MSNLCKLMVLVAAFGLSFVSTAFAVDEVSTETTTVTKDAVSEVKAPEADKTVNHHNAKKSQKKVVVKKVKDTAKSGKDEVKPVEGEDEAKSGEAKPE